MARPLRFVPVRGAVVEGTVRTRYPAVLVSEEEAAQVGRFRYILAQSVKEGLVAHARDWPGIHCVREILSGEPVHTLPCWAHLPPEVYRQRVAGRAKPPPPRRPTRQENLGLAYIGE